MIQLYKVTDDYLDALNAPDEDGVISFLDERDQLEEKLLAVAAYIRNLEAEMDMVDGRMAELSSYANKLSSRVSALRTEMADCMTRFEIGNVRGTELSVSVRAAPPSVIVDDAGSLPEEYIERRMAIVPRKDAIRRAMDAGSLVPGARLAETHPFVVIRPRS